MCVSISSVSGQSDPGVETLSYEPEDYNFIDSVRKDIASIKEEMVKIEEGYYVIRAEGLAGNIGVYTGKDEVVLVDNQWEELVPRIKEMIRSVTENPIKFIINTHIHFDHIDGNKAFGKENIPIIAHENVRERLKEDRVVSGTDFGNIVQKAYPLHGLPTVVFKDTLDLFFENETIRLIHFPNAHTDGDIIVHFQKADIYHMGDILVTYGRPVIDENNGGDIYALIRTIEYLISVSDKDTRFIPGHGQVYTLKELKEYSEMITSLRDQVITMVKKGSSLDDIINNVGKENNGVSKKTFIPHVYRMVLKHEVLGSGSFIGVPAGYDGKGKEDIN